MCESSQVKAWVWRILLSELLLTLSIVKSNTEQKKNKALIFQHVIFTRTIFCFFSSLLSFRPSLCVWTCLSLDSASMLSAILLQSAIKAGTIVFNLLLQVICLSLFLIILYGSLSSFCWAKNCVDLNKLSDIFIFLNCTSNFCNRSTTDYLTIP